MDGKPTYILFFYLYFYTIYLQAIRFIKPAEWEIPDGGKLNNFKARNIFTKIFSTYLVYAESVQHFY